MSKRGGFLKQTVRIQYFKMWVEVLAFTKFKFLIGLPTSQLSEAYTTAAPKTVNLLIYLFYKRMISMRMHLLHNKGVLLKVN